MTPQSNANSFRRTLPPPRAHCRTSSARLTPNSRERGWNILATPGTYILLAINIFVFGWMVLHGVSAKDPTTAQLVHYGATNAYLVLTGQWWRLVTATFVHVGLLHIATNMWCLWNLGLLGEPLLGPVGLIAVYLITGVAGNLLSLLFNVFHRDGGSVGAGASGAVFGIAGILIVLLSNKKLPIPAFDSTASALRHPVRRAELTSASARTSPASSASTTKPTSAAFSAASPWACPCSRA